MKRVILILCLVLSFSLVLASQSFEVNYDIKENNSTTFGPLQFDSVLLKVNTMGEMVCKYSLTEGIDYVNMGGNFDRTDRITHYLDLVDLPNAIHKYYIKCKNNSFLDEPGELEVIFRINSRVTGQIELSEDSPLKAGDLELSLYLDKVVSQTPILKYSVDGENYRPIVLFGSGDSWKGYLVLEKDLGEGVLSFQMKAVDLEGNPGDELTSGNAFQYDTIKPKLITELEAISKEGEIELEWHLDEDVDEFNIYRSTLKNPGHTDFYKSVDDEDYTDTNVEEGETYYYRISAVDRAGNEGDLSIQVSGTSLSEDSEDVEGGLDYNLRGKVDSFILEIENLRNNIDAIGISSLSEKEKELFENLGMQKEISDAKSELNSLESSVEKYKTQDLSESVLDQKIESSRVRLGIIERGVPEDLLVVEDFSRVEDFGEELVVRGLNEINNFLSEKEIENSVEKTFEMVEENGLKIQSTFYEVEVIYLDGSSKDFFVVNRDLNSELEKDANSYFVEMFLPSIVEDGKITVKNLDYDFVSDKVLTFGSDNKNIFYYVEGISGIEELKNIESGFVSVYEESSSQGNTITGFSIFEGESGKYAWIVILIFIGSIFAYFIYSKMNDFSDDYFRVLNKINGGMDLLKKKDINKSKKVYFEVKDVYKNLNSNEKQNVYKKIENLYNDIAILEIEEGLEELKKTKDKNLLKKLEKMYDNLSLIHKKKISVLFDKIRGEVENEK